MLILILIQGKTDRPSRLELGRQQQQQNDDGPGLLGPAPGGGFNPLLFLQNAHGRGPAMSKFFLPDFSCRPPSKEAVTNISSSHPVPSLVNVLRIRIRRIRMFVGLLDPDPLVRGPDLAKIVRKIFIC